MIEKTFVYDEDREFDGYGWRPVDMANGNCGGGLIVAHDTLEHFPGDSGSLTEELEALGAMLFIRGNFGYWGCKGSYYTDPHYHMASDLARFAQESWPLRRFGRSCALRDTEWEAEIALARAKAWHDIREETEPGSERNAAYDRLLAMVPWIRNGYRRAARRYRSHSGYDIGNLFWELEEAIDQRHMAAELGETLRVVVNVRQLTFRCFQSYPEDDWY